MVATFVTPEYLKLMRGDLLEPGRVLADEQSSRSLFPRGSHSGFLENHAHERVRVLNLGRRSWFVLDRLLEVLAALTHSLRRLFYYNGFHGGVITFTPKTLRRLRGSSSNLKSDLLLHLLLHLFRHRFHLLPVFFLALGDELLMLAAQTGAAQVVLDVVEDEEGRDEEADAGQSDHVLADFALRFAIRNEFPSVQEQEVDCDQNDHLVDDFSPELCAITERSEVDDVPQVEELQGQREEQLPDGILIQGEDDHRLSESSDEVEGDEVQSGAPFEVRSTAEL